MHSRTYLFSFPSLPPSSCSPRRYAQRWSDLHHFFYLPSATAERSWGAEYERRALEYRDMLVRYKTDAERFKHADAIKTMERLLQVMHICF